MYLQKVRSKKIWIHYFFLGSWRLLTKRPGSGSVSQMYGSTDPDLDPYQNVMDPQHCLAFKTWLDFGFHSNWFCSSATVKCCGYVFANYVIHLRSSFSGCVQQIMKQHGALRSWDFTSNMVIWDYLLYGINAISHQKNQHILRTLIS